MKSDSRKFIFVDIPKTGGSSINKVLSPYANSLVKHQPLVNYAIDSEFDLDEYFKFTFVRNPWEWVVSWYFYRQKEYNEYDVPFKKWLMDENSSAYNNMGIGLSYSQSFFVLDKDGNIGVDFIGRFENIEKDFSDICFKLNIPSQSLPLMNKTKHKPYYEYYDDESRNFVDYKFEKDIDLFSYEFNDKD